MTLDQIYTHFFYFLFRLCKVYHEIDIFFWELTVVASRSIEKLCLGPGYTYAIKNKCQIQIIFSFMIIQSIQTVLATYRVYMAKGVRPICTYLLLQPPKKVPVRGGRQVFFFRILFIEIYDIQSPKLKNLAQAYLELWDLAMSLGHETI